MQKGSEHGYLTVMNDDETRVYTGDISRLIEDGGLYECYLGELSSYRRDKAEKYKNQDDRCRSVGAGILLKRALSDCGLSEKDVKYGTTGNGKPVIEGFPGINFNLSHSKNRVMCIVSGRVVGCDVEQVRDRGASGKRIPERFFSEEERAYLKRAGSNDKEKYDEAFFTVWTLKESYIKCTGEGLERAMEGFSVIDASGCFMVKEDRSVLLKVLESDDPDDFSYRYAVCIKKRTPDDEQVIIRRRIIF